MTVKEPGKRLFVGARVAVPTANSIAAAAQMIARRAREAGIDLKWVPPANYHVTLKFLGQTRVDAIGALGDALDAAVAGLAPLRFKSARIGAFPSDQKARVIWAGVDDGGALGEVARRIEIACRELGFAAETRAFHPHVTIARAREARALREVVLPVSEQMFGDTRIDAISLFESTTDSKGSVYSELRRIAFKTARNTPETTSERQTGALELGASKREPVDIETDDGWPRGHGPAD